MVPLSSHRKTVRSFRMSHHSQMQQEEELCLPSPFFWGINDELSRWSSLSRSPTIIKHVVQGIHRTDPLSCYVIDELVHYLLS